MSGALKTKRAKTKLPDQGIALNRASAEKGLALCCVVISVMTCRGGRFPHLPHDIAWGGGGGCLRR